MEFSIDRGILLEALAACAGVVERKNTMPILSHALLEVTSDQLTLLATDLEIAIRHRLEAKVTTPGKATLQVRNLYDIVRESASDRLEFSAQSPAKVVICSGKSRFEIKGLAADEFPGLPAMGGTGIQVKSEQWLRFLEKTVFAVSQDDTRFHLSSVLVTQASAGRLQMVGTDGHRLAMAEEDFKGFPEGLKILIPRKGLLEMRKLLQPENDFELFVNDKNILVRQGRVDLYIRLAAGDYPDYARVIPQTSKQVAGVEKEAFVGALRRVALMANERSRGVSFEFSPGHLLISTSHPDLGSAQEELVCDYPGEVLKIGFNARYFLDVMGVIRDEKVTMVFNDALAPCVIRSEFDRGFLAVIMPMRI